MILELKNIDKNFGGVKAINNANLSVKKGEVFGLIGPNGAGKTTLFNIISGAYKPSSGEIIFDNKNITNLNQLEITKLGIARTFQNIRLFSSMSVLENVLIGLNCSINYNIFEAFLHIARYKKAEKQAREEAIKILNTLKISHLANAKSTELSYGEQRKLEIARALALKPKLLLLDEPVAGMNGTESNELADIITTLKKELSIVLIEHDMKFVNSLCDRVLVLDYGKSIFLGSPKEAVNNNEVIKAYLGDF
ncbi:MULTISPECIES: ABC transporter ATP-binding protein [unclassified Campylobacter]|uniref:ABC transporter ATP-binding protein n=1 Tax=unclassified Campylobacter TaxID=2593542 RepID=UPI001BD9E8F8|nr:MULTISPECIES: ABC transporter ATP-binding protein [unclassified Campylobacter]MBZ7977049.1 ABC transporter ATP-binding protein [Campylobacter sp. RM12637]MBZ7978849.1 ABC transporter ATP-binding protein [Campylobacter sp. RM12654]MBZ7980683.1 ABC transporter ATP-binding protein [Campylobacter sp. RM12642]MBZ7982761.1 ABC transporter ATP-binding protein [Campylobacter sp. RM12640]MBZ7984581.1 ABC transporter ATP-binding protein [Campylobacter sp. RM12647]MBZ7989905.1 ABC transporter ATP-bin